MVGFAKIVNEGADSFEGKTIKLMGDIDLSDNEWLPVGTSDKKFAGTFDGSEYKISNLTISDTDYAAFIAYTSEGVTVKNLTFENVNISSNKHAAGVVCMAGNKLTLEGITVTGMINAKSYAGGLVVSADNIGIDDCQNDADISAERAGGIASWIATDANVTNVTNNGNVTGSIGAGGIAQAFGGNIINAVNHGKITSNGVEPAAGIVGIQKAESSYKYCYNYGNVTSTLDNPNSSAAGILGHTSSGIADFKYCANYGNVFAEKSYAAGIGYPLHSRVVTNYCYNIGIVTGDDGAGAIAPKGQFSTGKSEVNFSLNAGQVISNDKVNSKGSVKYTQCFKYEESVLKDVSTDEEVANEEVLEVLNGGENKEFFVLNDGKIIVKQ